MRWKYLAALGAAAALLSTVSLAGPSPGTSPASASERAQMLPPPFGRPGPIMPGQASCSPQYQRLLKLQAEGMRQLQRLSRIEGDRLCSTLETAEVQGVDKLIDPKALEPLLTPDQRDMLGALGIDLGKVNVAKLMQRLGIDLSQVDLRNLTHQCRQSQGGIDRFAAGELRRVENEMIRCDDRV
jgi:hypothetical protein